MFIILCSAFIEYSYTIPKFRGAIKANDKKSGNIFSLQLHLRPKLFLQGLLLILQ